MEDGLNTIERSIVLDYMKENALPVTITMSEKSNVMIFPVAVNSNDIFVAGEDTLRMSSSVKKLSSMVGKSVKVSFYYNHVGLYFENWLTENQYGYFIQVPKNLMRVTAKRHVSKSSLKGVISYNIRGNQGISLEAFPKKDYALFETPRWTSVESALQSTAQNLYENFAYRINIQENEDISYLISVCRYLCQRLLTVAVEGTAEPLDIIYLDSSKIVFGCINQRNSFQIGNEYKLSLQFPIGNSPLLKRSVNVGIRIVDTFANAEGDIQCFLCKFRDIKFEDKRFLDEKKSL